MSWNRGLQVEEQNHCSQAHDSGVTEMGTRQELSHFKELEMYQTCELEHPCTSDMSTLPAYCRVSQAVSTSHLLCHGWLIMFLG